MRSAKIDANENVARRSSGNMVVLVRGGVSGEIADKGGNLKWLSKGLWRTKCRPWR